jgi:hypothetical protein
MNVAKSIGAVRFSNGDLLYFLWNHVVDVALPKLFQTTEAAEHAWNHDLKQDDAYALACRPGGEEVELMAWYEPGAFRADFRTRVDRQQMVIVGPLDHVRAEEEFGEPTYPEKVGHHD